MSEQAAEELAAQLREQMAAAQDEGARFTERLDQARNTRADLGGLEEAVPHVLTPHSEPAALDVIGDRTQPSALRREAITRFAPTKPMFDAYVGTLLSVVADPGDDSAVRLDALDAVAAAAFLVGSFEPHRVAYEDTLRDLLTDPEPAVREAAAGTLATARDRVLQDVLQKGLRGEGDLPVDRALAIRLLAQDDHLDNLPWLDELYGSDSARERGQAVQAMGSYPAAADRLEAVLRDRAEDADVRQQGGAALRYLDPRRFEAVAKEIATDPADDAQVRTSALTALQHLGDPEQVYGDADFVRRVQDVEAEEGDPDVSRVARDLLNKRPPG